MLRQNPQLASKWWEPGRFPLAEMPLPRPLARVYSDLWSLNCNSETQWTLKKERFSETNLVAQCEWNGWICLYFFPRFHVIICLVCCRNVDVVDCRLLPQTRVGFYIIHGAIVLNILDNVWAIILNFKITPYSAFTASVTLRFLAKGLYTYKSLINFAIVIS